MPRKTTTATRAKKPSVRTTARTHKLSQKTSVWDQEFLNEEQSHFHSQHPNAQWLITVFLGMVFLFAIVSYMSYIRFLLSEPLI